AAHALPRAPKGHKCARLHGHSFKIEVHVAGTVDPKRGWLMDYGDISRAFRGVHEQLDHSYLNDLPGLENPTSENLARWIWRKLKPALSGLSAIVVQETGTARCIYRGQ
ncbi:MAG: 6-carboxytetrahydropterin synthase QueD, partial [Verrucomicrobiae bacterium]|nr:6-carboxytetrahydropterin synthase QueD [Verrucomicrobiae bacterium]